MILSLPEEHVELAAPGHTISSEEGGVFAGPGINT